MTSISTETQNFLQTLKNEKHLSSDKIAKLLDTTVTTISRWRNGKFAPRADQFQKLKKLAEGTVSATQHGQGGTDEMQMDVLERLARIEKSLDILVSAAMSRGAARMPGYVNKLRKKGPGATGTHGQ